jgi:hypothetical protein
MTENSEGQEGRKEGRELSNGVSPNSSHFVRFKILIMLTNMEITIFWDVPPSYSEQ